MVLILVLLLLLDGIDQVRALADLAILDRLRLVRGFDVHANRRHLAGLSDFDSVLVDALDNDWLEVALPIRPKHHVLVQLNLALEHGTTEDQANTLAEVARVNDEFSMHVVDLLCLFELLLVLLIGTINHL